MENKNKKFNPAFGLMAIPAVLVIAVIAITVYGLNKK